MPTVTQLIQPDGTMRTPTVEDMANQLAEQAIQLATNGRIRPTGEHLTQRIVAASQPAPSRNRFDMRGTDKWLQPAPRVSQAQLDRDLKSLLING
jgi:hypothetical protein